MKLTQSALILKARDTNPFHGPSVYTVACLKRHYLAEKRNCTKPTSHAYLVRLMIEFTRSPSFSFSALTAAARVQPA